jgi:1-acyl-sn-glycerol-3-phosphate acyltransferase
MSVARAPSAAGPSSATSLVFFPEGTSLEGERLLPFRLGAFKAAVEAACPVVPVVIRGTRAILPAGGAAGTSTYPSVSRTSWI